MTQTQTRVNTDLEPVTFRVDFTQVLKQGYIAAVYEGTGKKAYGAGNTKLEALLDLYSECTERYFSFKLEVYEGNELVQVLQYQERH